MASRSGKLLVLMATALLVVVMTCHSATAYRGLKGAMSFPRKQQRVPRRQGGCLYYGHSCLGAHGKRNGYAALPDYDQTAAAAAGTSNLDVPLREPGQLNLLPNEGPHRVFQGPVKDWAEDVARMKEQFLKWNDDSARMKRSLKLTNTGIGKEDESYSEDGGS